MSMQLNKICNNRLCMIENLILTIQTEGSDAVFNQYM